MSTVGMPVRQKQRQKQVPIHAAVDSWLGSLPPSILESIAHQYNDHTSINDAKKVLLSGAPKRWVVYEPMVLLPSGSFSTQPWPALLSSLTPSQKESLWTAILRRVSPASKPPLTHLAINEGIPLHLGSGPSTAGEEQLGEQREATPEKDANATENVLRSPTHLHPLHGDFGPAPSSTPTRPSQADFDAALWVSTKQNGLVQVWAPAHTMFSRGNVKEKARLLAFHDGVKNDTTSKPTAKPIPDPFTPTPTTAIPTSTPTPTPPSPLDPTPINPQAITPTTITPPQRQRRQETAFRDKHALDLYAGIGYFALSLARLGLRVLCWELNAWSVEGLRRGAGANGVSVRVVVPSSGDPSSGSSTSSGLGSGLGTGSGTEVGDGTVSGTVSGAGDGSGDGSGDGTVAEGAVEGVSERAPEKTSEGLGEVDMAEILRGGEQIVVFLEDNRHAAGRVRGYREAGGVLEMVHVNCGFLPTSEPVWRDAWGMVVDGEGWLHLHENVGVADIEARRNEIQGMFDRWAAEDGNARKTAVVEHVELVKTYAPGVWHCVFDVFITTRSGVAE